MPHAVTNAQHSSHGDQDKPSVSRSPNVSSAQPTAPEPFIMQWAHAIFVILIVAVAWGAVFMWTEVFEHVIRDALKLPADSKTSKMILAVILTAVFLFVLFLIGGPQRIAAVIGDPLAPAPEPSTAPPPAPAAGSSSTSTPSLASNSIDVGRDSHKRRTIAFPRVR